MSQTKNRSSEKSHDKKANRTNIIATKFVWAQVMRTLAFSQMKAKKSKEISDINCGQMWQSIDALSTIWSYRARRWNVRFAAYSPPQPIPDRRIQDFNRLQIELKTCFCPLSRAFSIFRTHGHNDIITLFTLSINIFDKLSKLSILIGCQNYSRNGNLLFFT